MLSDTAVVDPLTPTYHLIWLKNNEKMMLLLSRAFRALRLSFQELDKYYSNVPQIYHRQYPLFPDVTITDQSEEAEVTFKVQISSQHGSYLLWEAILQADDKVQEYLVYVKAVQGKYYSLQVHNLLFESGKHAPGLIATTNMPGGWLLVYMERLQNHVTLDKFTHTLNSTERDSLKVEINRVVRILHDNNFVHGDLREGNILVCRNSEKACGFDVKLIDFEWSGLVGTACYSHFMNHIAIHWPKGAEDGKKVTIEHDNTMLKQTFQKTNLLQDNDSMLIDV